MNTDPDVIESIYEMFEVEAQAAQIQQMRAKLAH